MRYIMQRLGAAVGRLSLTHVLLFFLLIGLLLNLVELHGVNQTLIKVNRSLAGIDGDLTNPIDVNIPSSIDVNTEH
jgi:hypothetical protein